MTRGMLAETQFNLIVLRHVSDDEQRAQFLREGKGESQSGTILGTNVVGVNG